MSEIIRTDNHGPLVRASTFWGSSYDEGGYYYLSPNAGAIRLFIPRGKGTDMAEMRTAKEIVITTGIVESAIQPGMVPGREMSEILFDDRSDNPFALFLSSPEQWERPPADDDYKLYYEFTAWENRRGVPHKIIGRPCYLRRGSVPCLKPWPRTS